MGHGVSCARTGDEHDFFRAAQLGDLDALGALLAADASLARRATLYDRLSPLHIAAANGRLEALSMFLDRGALPDAVDRHKQTPLMLAAMHGKIGCVLKLLHAGANILMFDSVHARTCLHHAAYYGHVDCLDAILSTARTTPVADSWGFARFVNVRDDHGATPLHLAARQGRPGSVQLLLENGAIVSALTGSYGFPGSTPLHLAARSGSLDCVRKLLAWGADRLQRDSAGRIAYVVAQKRHHGACAALLNPSSAEPMVWPSPLKFISELDPEAKALLEAALTEANREREKKILKDAKCSPQSPLQYDDNIDDDMFSEVSDTELCCICFDQACTIEVEDCGHQMCAPCTLALCCHNKPNPATLTMPSPACPFCRGSISRLVVAQTRADNADPDRPASPQLAHRRSRRSHNLSEGSSSFKGLSSAISKITRGSSRMADSESAAAMDKPEHDL
ncbi:E3 ubiquitin-protein ligase XB3 [Hordeum vulgare subsp. vulgare]|uniref:RING-type E3 ubiquitin transferase n=1 Tax=Hordeum vulgare subsp. vulgare TaxID=112509 RepID=A0A8I6WGP4_HORVV|nr:E3 ubiquitin-protein ligase XB3 [Hordeum vulgare subsp. vulgare]